MNTVEEEMIDSYHDSSAVDKNTEVMPGSNEHNIEISNLVNPLTGSGETLAPIRYKNKNAKSSIWNYFEVYHDKKLRHLAYCILCHNDVNYTTSKSTGMLTRHLRRQHRNEFQAMVECEVKQKLECSKKNLDSSSNCSSITLTVDDSDKVQSSIKSFVKFTPSFEHKLLDWIIETYQPLQACEHPSFREMCRALNNKAPTVGKFKLLSMISTETALVRVQLKSILKQIPVTITTDAWTSCNNNTYITCTAHWICSKTWLLHHMPLGLFKKTGTSQAEDVVRYVMDILLGYDITYTNLICIVTDTEATMVKAARIFCSNAAQALTPISWHGCIDHLLNLVTKLAFKDHMHTEGTMAKARDLVGHFSSSSQAEEILLSKQVAGSAVKCIQDVTTRWWSTYSMCERLLRLKPYLNLMEVEGTLDKNLNDDQWIVIKDTVTVLEPFMCAQRLLEGESYVTISMIPFIIWKVRKGLADAVVGVSSSPHVIELATVMNNKFRELWGSGDPGTVATEHLTEGPRRRPKGIPKLALVASSLLDPRFKFGPGYSINDKNYIWNIVKQMMTNEVVGQDQNLNNGRDSMDAEAEGNQQNEQQRQSYVDAMFVELNDMAMAEEAENEHVHNNDNDDVMNRIDAELLLYKREQHLPLRKADGGFNNPLDWWRVKHQQYPILAALALKVLAIPATSAPSERVFSVAGITISKERAKLDPANAGELIFLHDARPALKRYQDSVGK